MIVVVGMLFCSNIKRTIGRWILSFSSVIVQITSWDHFRCFTYVGGGGSPLEGDRVKYLSHSSLCRFDVFDAS